MELNNTIATPLYKQLEEKLQHEIETGERPAGSRLPTENELSETYHVSELLFGKRLPVIRIRISSTANQEKELLSQKRSSTAV